MTPLVYATMYGFIPVVLLLFILMPARRAVIVGFLMAWLLLPMAAFPISGLPDYDKTFAACAGILLATLIFDPSRYFQLRFSLADIPILIWCGVPFFSSVTAGLGVYDGLSSSLRQSIVWGSPYLIGRLYFHTTKDLRELALGFFFGGLVYMPLCLYEIRMSPQLHRMFYGYHQHVFGQTKRFGGWRPTVFMQHGLAVGMWMTTASLVAWWLWRKRSMPRLSLVSPVVLLIGLLITTVLCKSVGALALLVVGAAVLYASLKLRSTTPILILTMLPILYIGARTVGGWNGAGLISLADTIVPARTASLQTRLNAEVKILSNAYQRPLFGWGHSGWLTYETEAGHVGTAVPDGFWLIAVGRNGFVGLFAVFAVQLLPAWLALRRIKRAHGGQPGEAGDLPLFAVLLSIYAIDNCLNAMLNPLFVLVGGGLVTHALSSVKPQGVRRTVGYRSATPAPLGGGHSGMSTNPKSRPMQ